MSSMPESLRAIFTQLVGRQPDSLWSAPGRVNLIGEHTDYNQGFVLPFAIDRRTLVALGTRDDGMLRVASTFADDAVEVALVQLANGEASHTLRGWAAYPLGVAWALGQFGADLGALPGLDLVIDSSVPAGAGLSSSAAIECAVALALNDVWQLGLTTETLALVGQRAENDVVGAPTGIMDQSASLLGRRDAAVFLDCRSLQSRVVSLGLDEAGLTIAVIDTGTTHTHSTGSYQDRRASCEAAAVALGVAALRDVSVADLDEARGVLDEVTFRRVRHVVTENQRVLDTVHLLETTGPNAIGALLDASHRSLRDDFQVSTPELDVAVETALSSGALGARMTGGGFGGAAIALVPSDGVPRLRDAVDAAFAEHGFGHAETFETRPSDGARREPS